MKLMSNAWSKKIIAGVLALSMLSLVACSKEEKKAVSTEGSTSMEKVIGGLSEAFKTGKGIQVSYNPTGSGSGIKAVQEGRCDIGLSSRKLKAEEESAGLVGTVLAYDGIAIVVHPQNAVKNLSMEQLAGIFKGELKNWQDVGGADAEIVVIGREAGSGTRDGFESITKTKDACKYRQELSSTGDVITAVSQNPQAIAYASLSTVKPSVSALQIEGVAPSNETVLDKSYPVQRPFLLVTKKETKLSAPARQFFDYVLSAEAMDGIRAAGVVPAGGK